MPLPIYPLVVYGAHPGTIGGVTVTGGFTVESLDGTPVTVIGETDTLTGAARGGGNTVVAEGEEASAFGDAQTVSGAATAGHNTVTSEAHGPSDAAGEGNVFEGAAQGGHNTVTATSSDGPANAYGDAFLMAGAAHGGYNTVSGSLGLGGSLTLYGDAHTLTGAASGGHNTLSAFAPTPNTTFVMYGDAFELSGAAHGGNNLLTSPDSTIAPVMMYGDGFERLGAATGGGNTLVAGHMVDDVMWGDAAVVSSPVQAAANTFIFSAGIGHDTIMDFRSGTDHIDLEGLGVSNFQQLSQLFQQTANGLDIVFNTSSSILLHGVSHVVAGDFVFS
jgi:hypothetical protein